MSQKRKLEEFHDPDYPQIEDAKRARTSSLSQEEKLEKIRTIVKREFQGEIAGKEEQVEEVDNRIAHVKQLLHQLRYAVVSDYYTKSNLQYNETETSQILVDSAEDEPRGPQQPIHPALKSILGTSAADLDEILRIRPTREAAKTAKTSIKEKLRTKKEEMRLQRQIKKGGIVIDHSKLPESGTLKVPRHIEPIKIEKEVQKLNAARGSNQTRHMIVVGNTSKYIGDEKASDGTTHKWLVYVQTKTPIAIEKFVKKVRFFLHESYRPNDVVDVDSPPFQIARRGWGEFPVRIQLIFEPKLQQKPLQLVHNLVLDKTLSGLQTMGAETLVEMWLRSESLPSTSTSAQSLAVEEPIITSIKQEIPEPANHIAPINGEIDENFLDFLNKIETPIECQDIDNIQPTVIDSPLVDMAFSRVPQGRPPAKNVTQAILSLEPATPAPIASIPPVKVPECNIAPIVKQQNSSINQPEKVQPQPPPKLLSPTPPAANQGTTKVLQRKVMQYIDKDGKMKTIQMLVAANPAASKLNGQLPTLHGQPKIVRLVGKPGTMINGNKIVAMPQVRTAAQPNTGKGAVYVVNGNKLQAYGQQTVKLMPRAGVTQIVRPPGPVLAPPKVLRPPPAKAMPAPAGKSSPRPSAPPKNQVFQRDGKMYIIDPTQTALKQQQRKQESLLKPQISLLKPRLPNGAATVRPTAVVADHDYQLKAAQLPKVRQTLPARHITLQSQLLSQPKSAIIPAKLITTPVTTKSVSLMKKPRRDHVKELEEKFLAMAFHQMRAAVEYLLRKLPVVNEAAKDVAYRAAFPFIVGTWDALKQLPSIKFKSNEWLRAKYISKCIRRHPAFKQKYVWSTKEILIFARQHAYTPRTDTVIEEVHSGPKVASDNFNFKKLTNVNGAKSGAGGSKSTLTDLIKSEMKHEKFSFQSVTLCHEIYDWIHANEKKLEKYDQNNDEVIDVDGLDEDNQAASNARAKKLESPMKVTSNKFWIPMDEKYEHEAGLVSQSTQAIGIRLRPEEIGNEIMYPAAQMVMAHSLRLFVEDLIRRSVAGKVKDASESSQPPTATTIQPEDLLKVISTRPQLDFLTNKHLGVVKSKEILDAE